MGTWEGMGIPLFGEYYRYSADQTEQLFVEDDGVENRTIAQTGTAADNLFALTVTDAATYASGYTNVFYISYSGDGAKTGSISGTQSNMIGMDITLNENCSFTSGIYIYVMEGSDDGPSAGDDFTGIDIYIEELGAMDYLTCLWLEKNNTTQATTRDCFILCNQHSGTTNALIEMQGQHPNYFLTSTATEGGFLTSSAPTGTEKYYIKVKIGASDFWIEAGTSA